MSDGAVGHEVPAAVGARRQHRALQLRHVGQASLPRVVGAVASSGALQVHDDGFRAEHACVVTLAHGADASPETIAGLERIARYYRADLVPLGSLEEAASRHGTPLPDDLRPPPLPEPVRDDPWDRPPVTPAPDATPEDVVLPEPPPSLRPKGLLPGWDASGAA